ncbi:MAG: hypothetical protein CVV27_15230 [Candidatus Melainabacteria bacterium HGW-Melainabacteria-1]|nr:MAG: hypothetical protein CVV27_15230 [Candidatus Melainabacteria bacterium HGW-Melainabacteria-1]
MKISIDDLKTERQWRSVTGYTEAKFRKLLAFFEPIYTHKMGEAIESIKAKSPRESAIKTCEDLLFFTLFSLKSGLTYDNLGLVTGMDGSNAKRNQDLGISLLKETLQAAEVAPKREFASVDEFQELFKDAESLIIDGTEQRVERPQEEVSQKANYSGKKKLTPLKRPSFPRKTRSSAS